MTTRRLSRGFTSQSRSGSPSRWSIRRRRPPTTDRGPTVSPLPCEISKCNWREFQRFEGGDIIFSLPNDDTKHCAKRMEWADYRNIHPRTGNSFNINDLIGCRLPDDFSPPRGPPPSLRRPQTPTHYYECDKSKCSNSEGLDGEEFNPGDIIYSLPNDKTKHCAKKIEWNRYERKHWPWRPANNQSCIQTNGKDFFRIAVHGYRSTS